MNDKDLWNRYREQMQAPPGNPNEAEQLQRWLNGQLTSEQEQTLLQRALLDPGLRQRMFGATEHWQEQRFRRQLRWIPLAVGFSLLLGWSSAYLSPPQDVTNAMTFGITAQLQEQSEGQLEE